MSSSVLSRLGFLSAESAHSADKPPRLNATGWSVTIMEDLCFPAGLEAFSIPERSPASVAQSLDFVGKHSEKPGF